MFITSNPGVTPAQVPAAQALADRFSHNDSDPVAPTGQ